MKIAFSTLGCPDFGWMDIYSMAKDFHFDGIEIRGLGQNIMAATASPFTERQIDKTRAKLASLHLEIPCLSSGCCLKYPEKRAEVVEEIRQYVDLAVKLSTPFIRILGDQDPAPAGEVDDEYVADVLTELADIAQPAGVTLLVETNGVYADTRRLAALLDAVARPSVAALWDMHHPYRHMGEAPRQTVSNLGARIRYTHTKDSVSENGKVRYRMMGEGDLPVYEMLDALKDSGYDGYVSLEWVKRWAPELTDAGIVFPHFQAYMQGYFEGHMLQLNARGTGKYVWKKEHLIETTFPEVLDRMVREFPDQYAFRYTTHYYTRTYAQFRDDVDAFARSLIAMGVEKGDHVAIWATNVPQWFITFWAAVKIGAVLVTVNTAYKIHEAEYLLRQSDTHTLVMVSGYKDSNYVEIMRELCPELETARPGALAAKRLPRLKNIITVECDLPGAFTWDEAMEMGETVPLSEVTARARSLRPHDVCNMQYTSGTTGFPKGVMLTHYNVVNNGKAIGDCMDLSTADRLMIQVPMFHCFGMVLAMTASMTHGTTMSPIPYFSPRVSLDCINREKITAFHGVPTMFIAMLEHPDFEKTDFSHVRTGIMAGSPCPVKVMREVLDKMHMDEICITYGQTEASPATQSRVDDHGLRGDPRIGTVGRRAVRAWSARSSTPRPARTCPTTWTGSSVARGYNIMKGYYKMPEATAAAIDADGWLHTGDLARRVAGGNFKHHRPHQGHDHPRRREHLPQGDRGIPLHPPGGPGRAGDRRARQAVRRGDHGRGHPEGGRKRYGRGAQGLLPQPHGQAQVPPLL